MHAAAVCSRTGEPAQAASSSCLWCTPWCLLPGHACGCLVQQNRAEASGSASELPSTAVDKQPSGSAAPAARSPRHPCLSLMRAGRAASKVQIAACVQAGEAGRCSTASAHLLHKVVQRRGQHVLGDELQPVRQVLRDERLYLRLVRSFRARCPDVQVQLLVVGSLGLRRLLGRQRAAAQFPRCPGLAARRWQPPLVHVVGDSSWGGHRQQAVTASSQQLCP